MKPTVVPIIEPRINWTLYLENTTVRRWLDFHRMEPGTTDSFLKSLEFFSQTNGNHLLAFVTYSFLIEVDKEICFDISTRTKLRSLPSKPLSLISGTLDQWKEACSIYCSKEEPFELRYAFDCIFIYLNTIHPLGLKKITLPDETFILS